MKVHTGCLRTAAVLVVVLSNLLLAVAQQAPANSVRIDRLAALARLWAAVKYFHPYLAYRDDIDWDGALVKAIPKVNAAQNSAEYSAAVADMLNALGDPVTHVLSAPASAPPNPSPSGERQPTFHKTAEGVLVVTMTNYSDFQDFVGTAEKLAAIKNQLPIARGVVFDLRPAAAVSEEDQGNASYSFSSSGLPGAITTVSLELPGERRRMHVGYAPQDGTSSGGYSSGFYFQGRPAIKPATGAKDIPVVFLIGPHSDLPDLALGLQASGRGAIVTEGKFNEEVAVSTQIVELPDGVRTQIRLGEMVYGDGTGGFAASLAVPASDVKGDQNPAVQAAIQLANTGKFSRPSHSKLAQRAVPLADNIYADMPYPPTEYRVLAAFRIWAVIEYFFPYMEFMGEDWNQVLRQFIPRMEAAEDALDYNLTVLEMVTHTHDSHGGASSPVLLNHFGDASLPVRVRMIEGLPVITGYTNAEAAKGAGLEIGDVVLKVDGEDASQLISDRLKYVVIPRHNQACSMPRREA